MNGNHSRVPTQIECGKMSIDGMYKTIVVIHPRQRGHFRFAVCGFICFDLEVEKAAVDLGLVGVIALGAAAA